MPGRVFVVTGPTATGKSELGVLLAKEIGGEVVSADSMQVYRGMDIGTAKPSKEEMGGVPHHMLDVAEPYESYSVARYVEEASRCCDEILARGKTPVIAGGTGLYIDSLLSGRDFAPRAEDGEARRRLERLYEERGGEALLRLLAERDPERAAKLHPNDKKRIVRALEVSEGGGTLTAHDRATKALPPRYEARTVVLNFADRAELYERIDRRVDRMLERGLVEEVRGLLARGTPRDCTAMQAIGYKELAAALLGEVPFPEAVEAVKRGSRRYAKRQISWCARYKDALRINWDKTPDFSKALRLSTDF